MKVQVTMTLDLNRKDMKSYMKEMGCDEETVGDYVRSYTVSCIPEMLSQNLSDNGYESEVTLIKSFSITEKAY